MIPKLSEATIRCHALPQSFERGQAYYHNGSVYALVQRGNSLSGRVEGSEAEAYRINIHFEGGITQAICTCPYDYEGWCKHIVATLLACLRQPEQIEQRPDFAEVLALCKLWPRSSPTGWRRSSIRLPS